MVIEHEGDIFATDYKLRIQGLNPVGVIGGGISGAFNKHYPGLRNYYTNICNTRNDLLGTTKFYGAYDSEEWTGLCFTQPQPGPCAKLTLIQSCLHGVIEFCDEQGIDEFAMCAIGCGIGGLNYPDVLEAVHTVCDLWPGTCHIYKPWEA